MPSSVAAAADRARRLRSVAPSTLRRLSIASLVSVAAIVLTGAAVRVTGSGLGCSDWPTCTKTHLTPPLEFHSLVEFSNRMVTVVLVVLIGATFLAALFRRPFRRDLAWLAGGLIAGVLAEAVIGGIVVYTKLNPYLVMVHFLATLLLLVDAVVLVHRTSRDYSAPGRLLVPTPILMLARGVLVLLAVVVTAGSATTGTAPDGGGASGQHIAPRIPMALRDMAELHATLALFLVGVVLSLAIALHALDVPERVRKAARMLVAVLVLQAAVGYAQYFTRLPAALVELHELGATVLVIGTVQFFLALTHRLPERAPVGLRVVPDLVGAGGGQPAPAASAPS
ncbi:MAG: COX15/CtaA family protein, partial [Actinomycetota bacterium]|nr:COX15/CtaA family protein [Actinomycetota bacterium]